MIEVESQLTEYMLTDLIKPVMVEPPGKCTTPTYLAGRTGFAHNLLKAYLSRVRDKIYWLKHKEVIV